MVNICLLVVFLCWYT